MHIYICACVCVCVCVCVYLNACINIIINRLVYVNK